MKRSIISPLMAALMTRTGAAERYSGPPPARMNVYTTPLAVMQAFEVWFNGELQTRCTVADAEKGYVVRYKDANGKQEERVEGKVEFRRRGLP